MIQSINKKIFDVFKNLSIICNPLKSSLRSHSWSWPNIENEQMVKWPIQLSCTQLRTDSKLVKINEFFILCD